jgi:hypothetical protein
MENSLIKQLEDKKKELLEWDIQYLGTRFTEKLEAEIAILEQAIAEKKKRDEEVDNAIDFLSSYPIWTKIYHKEDGDTEEIPDELYPILDNFLVMIKKVLKQQLNQPKEVKDGS